HAGVSSALRRAEERMKRLLAVLTVWTLAAPALGVLAMALDRPAPRRAVQATAPLRIFLRGGPKTHGPAGDGHHDGPTFVKEWTPLLTSRGAKVDGALVFPTADQLENTDVLVMFCANGGYIEGEQRAYFEKFLKRGGGLVVLH